MERRHGIYQGTRTQAALYVFIDYAGHTQFPTRSSGRGPKKGQSLAPSNKESEY